MDSKKTTCACDTHHNHSHGECSCSHSHDIEPSDIKKDIIRLSMGAILLIFAMVLKDVSFYVSLGFFIAAYVISGGEVLINAVKNLLRFKPMDENFLMAIATIGAFAMGEFAEGVAVMLFYGFGEMLQGLAVHRSKKSISQLMDIRPDFARVVKDSKETQTSPENISVGDIISVYPGEKIPLDGTVISGTSFVDTSALTGESVPAEVTVGSHVLSGCVNGSNTLSIMVSALFSESTASKVISMMEEAADRKSPSEQFITRFARIYTPVVVLLAIIVAFVPPLFLGYSRFGEFFYASLSFLIISCPCSLVVSIPVGFFAGLGCASKNGILIKGGNYLDALSSLDTVVFDKTGTLTMGKFQISEIFPAQGISEDALLESAAAAEQMSSHPIGKSILNGYSSSSLPEVTDFTDEAGYGISCTLHGEKLLVGKPELLSRDSIDFPLSDSPYTPVYVALGGRYLGCITVSDTVKPESGSTIRRLQKLGISCYMLTGDRDPVAKRVSADLHLNGYESQLLPGDKIKSFESRMSKTGKTAFVGDGINDAPVLSRADIGFAMGGVGSDAAIEAADIVFMDDDIEKIITSIKISKKTKRIVKENIVFSLAFKIGIMTMSIAGFSSLWMAIIADVGVALACIANSIRALKK